jgi:hypothetical protein
MLEAFVIARCDRKEVLSPNLSSGSIIISGKGPSMRTSNHEVPESPVVWVHEKLDHLSEGPALRVNEDCDVWLIWWSVS